MDEVMVLSFATDKLEEKASRRLTELVKDGWLIHTVTGMTKAVQYGTGYVVYTMYRPSFYLPKEPSAGQFPRNPGS